MDHRLIEGLMEVIAPLIKEYVEAQIVPLRAKLTEYEAREPLKGEPGKDADPVDPAIVANLLIDLMPVPENGKDADPEVIAEMVAAEFAKIDPPKDGKDVDPELVAVLVSEQVEKAVAAIERPQDGKDADPALMAEMIAAEVAKVPPGKDGKDVDPELVAVLVSEQVDKAMAGIAPPQDGKSVTLDDVLPVLEEMVGKRFDALPVPKDGRDGLDGKDGISVTIEELEPKISGAAQKAVDALPKMPTSLLIDAEGSLVAVYPDGQPKAIGKVRGEDGARGASVMDGEVDDEGHLMLRMSDGRQVRTGKVKGESGRPGQDGVAGARGRDAHEIQIIPGVDENRSYAAGVCACWRGGIIRAERQTDPIVDGDILAAGWMVYLNGVADESETAIDDGREIERVTTYTNGKSFARRFKTAMPIDRGVWKEKDGGFIKGDGVSFGGSFFIAQRDTTDKPEISDAWRLAVKRGRNGADGKLIPPRGGPVKI